MRRYLVTAPFEGDHATFGQILESISRDGPAEFHLVIPAVPPFDRTLVWSEEEAHQLAQERLDEAISRLRQAGLEASGEVGDVFILNALDDALRNSEFDELIIATAAGGISEALKMDLVSKAKRRFKIPVRHVIDEGGKRPPAVHA